jgi:hypothetical protein
MTDHEQDTSAPTAPLTQNEAPPDYNSPLRSLPAYTQYCVHLAGSMAGLARVVGFSTGSRIADWVSGAGRPSEIAAAKMAHFSGHDLIEVLRLARYDELADIIERTYGQTHTLPAARKAQLEASLSVVEDYLEMARKHVQGL